jgi:hypothetical protein
MARLPGCPANDQVIDPRQQKIKAIGRLTNREAKRNVVLAKVGPTKYTEKATIATQHPRANVIKYWVRKKRGLTSEGESNNDAVIIPHASRRQNVLSMSDSQELYREP